MTTFVALLRRELWEHRSLVIVPGVLAALILAMVLWAFGYALMHGGLAIMVGGHSLGTIDDGRAGQVIPSFYLAILAFFGIVLGMVSVPLYLVDCLYADRRDRSILFWKSLPISDAETVLSKLATGLFVAPAVTILAAFVTAFLVALVGTIVLWAASIEGVSSLWQLRPLLTVIIGVPLVTVLIALWYAPVAAWCLLASAWAPRAPLLWALLPPVALGVVEPIAYRTHYVFDFLGDRLAGVFWRLFDTRGFTGFGVHDGDLQGGLPALRDVTGYLTSMDLWGGVAVAIVFTAAAVALRRYRDET